MISATAAIDFGTKRGAGTATGFVNGIGSIGAILGGYLPGMMTTETDWTPFFTISLVGLDRFGRGSGAAVADQAADGVVRPRRASAGRRHDSISLDCRKQVVQLRRA